MFFPRGLRPARVTLSCRGEEIISGEFHGEGVVGDDAGRGEGEDVVAGRELLAGEVEDDPPIAVDGLGYDAGARPDGRLAGPMEGRAIARRGRVEPRVDAHHP